MAEPPTVGVLVGGVGPSAVDCQALPDAVVAGPLAGKSTYWGDWLQGPGVLRAGASLLVGG